MDDMLLKIMMQDLLLKIRDGMWNGRLPIHYYWDGDTQAAVEAEKLLIARELAKSKPIFQIKTSTVEPDKNFPSHQKKIEVLAQKLNQVNLMHIGSNYKGNEGNRSNNDN